MIFAKGARYPERIDGRIGRSLLTNPSPASQTMLSCPRSSYRPIWAMSSSNDFGSGWARLVRNRQGGASPPDGVCGPLHNPRCSMAASSVSARSIPSQRNLSAGLELPLCSWTLNLRILTVPSSTAFKTSLSLFIAPAMPNTDSIIS